MTPYEVWRHGYNNTYPTWAQLPLPLMAVFIEGRRAHTADEWCDDRNNTTNPYRPPKEVTT